MIEDSAAGDEVHGGTDGATDTLDYSTAAALVNVDLSGVPATDTATDFEHLIGSGFGDTLTGAGVGETIDGGVGVDTIHGGAGADILNGGDDGDFIFGDAGRTRSTAVPATTS